MPNSFSTDIRTYALAGAQAQLNQLNEEREQIHRLFPELRNGTAKGRVAGRVSSDADTSPSTSRRRGLRTMSATQRNAVGERMKRYWAAKRAGASASATETTAEARTAGPTKTARAAKGAKRKTAKRGPRKMSAAARNRISDAQKKRWAAKRSKAA